MLEELSCRVLQHDDARNEHDARASIDVRPAFELHRRMKHVMHAVNGDRCVLADRIEDTLTRGRSWPAPLRSRASQDETASQATGSSLVRQQLWMPPVWACSAWSCACPLCACGRVNFRRACAPGRRSHFSSGGLVLRAGSNKAVPNISSGAIFRVAPGLSALSLRSSSASSSAATRSVLVSKRQPARAACLTASVFSSICRRPLTASTVVATAQRRARHRA